MTRIFLFLLVLFLPLSLKAQTLNLKVAPTDDDGTVTVSDVFDGESAIGGVVLGYRQGTALSLDAPSVQATLLRNGVRWDNPQGVRRIKVTQGAVTVAAPVAMGRETEALALTRTIGTGEIIQGSDVRYVKLQAHQVPQNALFNPDMAIGKVARQPLREGATLRTSDLSSPIVVKRNEAVSVIWSSNGVTLGITGIAQKDASIGDIIFVQNPNSKKMIEVLITAPGQGVTGPLAQQIRRNQTPQTYANR